MIGFTNNFLVLKVFSNRSSRFSYRIGALKVHRCFFCLMKMNHSKILYNSPSWEFRAKDISLCRLMRCSSWCPDIQARVTMHNRPILAISCFSSHLLHLERGRRPRIHKGSENSFLNNSACSSLKMATKSVAKAAMKRDWKDKARDRVGAVSLSADTPSWYNSLQIMLPFF